MNSGKTDVLSHLALCVNLNRHYRVSEFFPFRHSFPTFTQHYRTMACLVVANRIDAEGNGLIFNGALDLKLQ